MSGGTRRWASSEAALWAALAAVSAGAVALAVNPLREDPRFTRVALPRAIAGPPRAGPPETPADIADEGRTRTAEDPTDLAVPGSAAAPAAPVELVAAAPVVDPRLGTPLLDTRFDLSRPGGGEARTVGDAVVIRKTLRYRGATIGSAAIHVDGKSRLLVDVTELRAILQSAGLGDGLPALKQEQGLATFVELRRLGIDLRYDPGADTIDLAV